MIGETYMPSTWLALKTAQLYYLENMSQKEIASILNISNVTVSRMLQRAKDLGDVYKRQSYLLSATAKYPQNISLTELKSAQSPSLLRQS